MKSTKALEVSSPNAKLKLRFNTNQEKGVGDQQVQNEVSANQS